MRKMVIFSALLTVLSGLGMSAAANENGPQQVPCDFKFGKSSGSDKCLIHGNGAMNGVNWTVFEVKHKRFRFDGADPTQLEALDESNKPIATLPMQNMVGQCKSGGPTADIYLFKNGDKVCLYW